jgi:amino acid adenylation domain-containing protein
VGAEVSAVDDKLKVNASTRALTPNVRAEIAEHKHELLALLRDRERLAALDNSPIVPISRADRLPLSMFQQRLWILDQLRRENDPRFNLVTCWPMTCRDPDLLKRAIFDVVRRHEILRSSILSEATSPFVRLLPPEAAIIEVSDLSALSGSEQRTRIAAEVIAAVTEPCDFTVEPPLRWRIYITEGGRLVTRVCADHIAVDEWSLVLLRKELDASLEACAAGLVLAPPPLQYADYAAWERRRQASPRIAEQLAWWEKRLANLPAFCAPPPDRHQRLAISDAYGFAWDNDLTSRLRAFARENRATLYMTLLSAMAVLLRAATGRGDIAMGTALGSRERPELESMIGAFVNLVVLRLDLEDDPSFAELLSRARAMVLDAHDHREVSFDMLVERLNPPRSLDFTPWFQVSVVMHNASVAEPSQIYSGGTAQHMTWFSRETETGLSMSIEYRSDLYALDTIKRMAGQLERLLRTALEDPLRKVSTLPLLSTQERLQVTAGFNATDITLDSLSMIEQFERQVACSPESIVLRFAGDAVSYDALNRRANRIARHLRGLGAAGGSRVGICLERSTDLLAALLAVAKTGAAYVPLDPGFPATRLRYMVEHSELEFLIVESEGQLDLVSNARVIPLQTDASAIKAQQDSNLGVVPVGKDPAYIIYTSGSTGRPNGVVVSHSALTNFLGAMQREPSLCASDILAAVSTISFDIAGLELYLPLLVGACIVMVPRAVATDGEALAQLLGQERVTVMQATPATWRLLLAARWPGSQSFVALCGGESLPPDLAQSLASRVGALWNLYGPTETTVWSTASLLETDADPVTVGRPIANTQVYILDSAGSPLPVGMPGEIWIGGAGVANGYWRNPELTDSRFHRDPYSGAGRNGMMYRTGDMGRWLPDGRIVHMGRIDRQVKLRGYRIEPAEIEAALASHSAVRESAVVLRGATSERERLVAYIVYWPGSSPTVSELREHLRSLLPEYMIPSMFLPIGAIPWTPNGKLDRSALPDPFHQAGVDAREYVAPATDAEEMIAGIWTDALAVERVGANDNFFDLGGHSLLGLRVAASIHERTGWRMPPYMMLQQTLRQIAASLNAHLAANGIAG